ncbi:unnamed protein product [Alternaria alternata]
MAFEMFSSVRIVAAFGAEAKLARQHESLLDKAAKNERRAAPLMGLMMSPLMVGQYGTFAIAFWFGIKQYSEGKIKEPDISANSNIIFDNVAFSYPSRPNVQILGGLDLDFEAGKVTATVRPVWKCWFKKRAEPKTEDKQASTEAVEHDKSKDDEPELGPNTCTGNIRTGNTNLLDVDLKWWRSQIGLVQQEPFLFNDTLYNNVAFGLTGTQYEDLPKEEDKMKMARKRMSRSLC